MPKKMKLVHRKTGKEIKVGDKVTGHGEEDFIIKALYPPQHPASEGHVMTNKGRFYASVVNAKYTAVKDKKSKKIRVLIQVAITGYSENGTEFDDDQARDNFFDYICENEDAIKEEIINGQEEFEGGISVEVWS